MILCLLVTRDLPNLAPGSAARQRVGEPERVYAKAPKAKALTCAVPSLLASRMCDRPSASFCELPAWTGPSSTKFTTTNTFIYYRPSPSNHDAVLCA